MTIGTALMFVMFSVPAGCFIGCLIGALGELWAGREETTAERQARRWHANADKWQ